MPYSSPLGDFLGWCLVLLLPAFAMAGPLRRDQGAAWAYLIVVLLHVAAVLVYSYLPGILPIRADASTFHKYAVLRQYEIGGAFGVGSAFFREYLAHVYSWVGPSWLFASLLSIYAFALSVVILVKLMEVLDVQQGKGIVVFLFGALPTAVLYGTVPLREPYQVLFFMLACYGVLKFRLTKELHHLVGAIVSALLMGLLHKGLIIYAPFLVTTMLFLRVGPDRMRLRPAIGGLYLHRLAALALAIGFVVAIFSAERELEGVQGVEVLTAAARGDLVDFAKDHRDEEALTKGRTAYGAGLDIDSPLRFVYTIIILFMYYMFTPFPWQIEGLMDVYAFGEVILRVLILGAIFRMWRRGSPVRPQIVILLMVVYASMAFLWAAGTSNWGTATRHHMIHQWILLALGVPALIRALPGLGRHHPTAPRAAALRFSGWRDTRVEPRVPNPSVVTCSPLPRLGRQPRSLQIGKAAPRLLAGGLRRPRRLAQE